EPPRRGPEQNDGLRGDAFGAADRAEPFAASRFDVRGVGAHVEELGDVHTHAVEVGRQARLFGEDRDVGVRDAIAAGTYARHRLAYEVGAAATFVAAVGVRVLAADVAGADRAEQRVRQRGQRRLGGGGGGGAPP